MVYPVQYYKPLCLPPKPPIPIKVAYLCGFKYFSGSLIQKRANLCLSKYGFFGGECSQGHLEL